MHYHLQIDVRVPPCISSIFILRCEAKQTIDLNKFVKYTLHISQLYRLRLLLVAPHEMFIPHKDACCPIIAVSGSVQVAADLTHIQFTLLAMVGVSNIYNQVLHKKQHRICFTNANTFYYLLVLLRYSILRPTIDKIQADVCVVQQCHIPHAVSRQLYLSLKTWPILKYQSHDHNVAIAAVCWAVNFTNI